MGNPYREGPMKTTYQLRADEIRRAVAYWLAESVNDDSLVHFTTEELTEMVRLEDPNTTATLVVDKEVE